VTRDQWMRLLRLAFDQDDNELAHAVALEMANEERSDLTRRGVGPKQARLNADTVTELRTAYWSVPRLSRPSYGELAQRYGIRDSTVSRIINRQRYADLPYVSGESDAAPIDLNAPDALEAARRARGVDALEGGGDIATGTP